MKTEASPAATALFALTKLEGVGSAEALRIAEDCEIPYLPFSDHLEALSSRVADHYAGVSESGLKDVWTSASEQLEEASGAGIQIFSFYDEKYPERLRRIPGPPAVLFLKGSAEALHSEKNLGVVGTREPTPEGRKIAYGAARTAAGEGFVIVSGLARGCDTCAHEGCLDVRGRSIAVLAHGLDMVYPPENRDLADRLVEHGGCLLSEYAFGEKPSRPRFTQRDRIQSGLSEGVLVIEAHIGGGTMHTAAFAREQKRRLACIRNGAEGNRKLLNNGGATPIADGGDFEEFLKNITLAGLRESAVREAAGSSVASRQQQPDE